MVKKKELEMRRLQREASGMRHKLGTYSQNKDEFWELIADLIEIEIEMESLCNE